MSPADAPPLSVVMAVRWHAGHVWPERAQAEDFLQRIREGRET